MKIETLYMKQWEKEPWEQAMENKKPPKTSSQRQVYKHDDNERSTEEWEEARGGMRVWGERKKHGQTQVIRQTDQRLEEREREKEGKGKKKKTSECWEKRRENRSEEISIESERGRVSHQVDGQFSDGNIWDKVRKKMEEGEMNTIEEAKRDTDKKKQQPQQQEETIKEQGTG